MIINKEKKKQLLVHHYAKEIGFDYSTISRKEEIEV